MAWVRPNSYDQREYFYAWIASHIFSRIERHFFEFAKFEPCSVCCCFISLLENTLVLNCYLDWHMMLHSFSTVELQVELSIFLYHRLVPGCNYQCIYDVCNLKSIINFYCSRRNTTRTSFWQGIYDTIISWRKMVVVSSPRNVLIFFIKCHEQILHRHVDHRRRHVVTTLLAIGRAWAHYCKPSRGSRPCPWGHNQSEIPVASCKQMDETI